MNMKIIKPNLPRYRKDKMDLKEIPDHIFNLAMLRLICANLKITEKEIQKMAILLYKGSRLNTTFGGS